jgi:hypothetical protein
MTGRAAAPLPSLGHELFSRLPGLCRVCNCGSATDERFIAFLVLFGAFRQRRLLRSTSRPARSSPQEHAQEPPRDANWLARSIVEIAAGETEDREPTPEEEGKDPAAVSPGRRKAATKCPARGDSPARRGLSSRDLPGACPPSGVEVSIFQKVADHATELRCQLAITRRSFCCGWRTGLGRPSN